jgi:hypothetical protein
VKRTPLARRTPLQQKGGGLKRGTSTLRRTKVKPMSEKRQWDNDMRRLAVAVMLAEHPACQAQWACRGARAIEVHERLKRSRGGSIVDLVQSHAITICRACHEKTESEVATATRLRLLIPSWHVCPPIGPC